MGISYWKPQSYMQSCRGLFARPPRDSCMGIYVTGPPFLPPYTSCHLYPDPFSLFRDRPTYGAHPSSSTCAFPWPALLNDLFYTLITYGSSLIPSLLETDQPVFLFQVPDLVPSPLFCDHRVTYGVDTASSTCASSLLVLLSVLLCELITYDSLLSSLIHKSTVPYGVCSKSSLWDRSF